MNTNKRKMARKPTILELTALPMFLVLLLLVSSTTANLEAEVDELFEEYFRWKLSDNPEEASLLGYHEYDGRLTDHSPRAAVRRELRCRHFRKEAERLYRESKAGGDLDREKRGYVRQMGKEAKFCEEGMKYKGYLLGNIHFMGGVQKGLPRFFKTPGAFKLDKLEDFQTVLKALKGVPKMMGGIKESLEAGIKQKVTYSAGVLSRVDKQFDKLQVNKAEESAFFKPFEGINRFHGSDGEKKKITDEAKRVIMEVVLPAFQNLNDFVQGDYQKHLRSSHGVKSIPDGDKFYQKCLEHHTTMEGITAEEVHQIGLDAVEELKAGVMAVAERLGKGEMGFSEFLNHVRESPEFKFKSKEEGLELFEDIIRNKIGKNLYKVLPDRLLKIPAVQQVDIVVPEGTSGTASYAAPAKDGSRNGTFYINLNDLNVFQKTVATTLALHEALPGHHFQAVHDQAQNFPDFLRFGVTGPTATSPSRTPVYTAHAEGWGLYSEFLGREMGVFEGEDYQLLGHYSYNLLRAARLVVDTGMHAMGWDRQRVVDYLLANTAFSGAYVQLQADRYAGWPGQATAYKMGERAIRSLREKKEKEDKDFDVKEFHADILGCLGFMDNLDECVGERENERNSQQDRESRSASAASFATVSAIGFIFSFAVARL